jgi:hypothetical protein
MVGIALLQIIADGSKINSWVFLNDRTSAPSWTLFQMILAGCTSLHSALYGFEI